MILCRSIALIIYYTCSTLLFSFSNFLFVQICRFRGTNSCLYQRSIPKTKMDTIKRMTHWFRSSKNSEHTTISSEISSSSRSGLYDLDSSSPRTRLRFPPRQVKKPQQCTIDKEYNAVLVSSYGDSTSESGSDGSDWSIGWLEPHGPGFELGIHQKDSSFAVLVPCYKSGTIQQEASSLNRFSGVHGNARTVSGEFRFLCSCWYSQVHFGTEPGNDCLDDTLILQLVPA
jgi:hypothetical protein